MATESPKTQEPQFSKLRAAIWPIEKKEMKKFLPMSIMMFFILFVYTILRNQKDGLIVGASGAEAISFLKTFGVLPISIVFVILYSKLANRLSRQKVFYIVLGSFVAFFGSFALLIYPNHEALHPSQATVDSLTHAVPWLEHLFSLYGNWTYALFYIMSEMWGSVILSLLFWQFANHITRTREAKRFYPMFPLIGNVGLVCAGPLVAYLGQFGKHGGGDAQGTTLMYLMALIVIAGIGTMATYWWMNKKVLTDPEQFDAVEADGKPKKDKPKLSIKDGFKYVLSSRYLGCIALLVLCYGVSINLVEVTWKAEVKHFLPNKNDFLSFQGMVSAITGVSTIAFIMFSKGIIRKFGWFVGAVLTPIVLMVTGTLFYAFVIFKGELGWLSVLLGAQPILLAVIFGTAQNFLSKSTKYTLFDPTKEMAYIPLDQELKVKGKAAVDVVGGRAGKAGGAAIQTFALMIAGAGATQISLAPIFGGIMVAMTIVWIIAAGRLAKLYNVKAAEAEAKENAAHAVSDPVGDKAQPVEPIGGLAKEAA